MRSVLARGRGVTERPAAVSLMMARDAKRPPLTGRNWRLAIALSCILSLPGAGSALAAVPGEDVQDAVLTAAVKDCLSQDMPETCIREPYRACEALTPMHQPDLNWCARKALDAWTARLAMELPRLQDLAPEEVLALTSQAQTDWEAWVAKDCEARALPSQRGTMYSMLRSSCRADHTARRVIEIKARADFWFGHQHLRDQP